MKVSKQLGREVAELYRQTTMIHATTYVGKTRSYVSVKIADRHLSAIEHAQFTELLRQKYGAEFLIVKNSHSIKYSPYHRNSKGILESTQVRTEKVTVRFSSCYPQVEDMSDCRYSMRSMPR